MTAWESEEGYLPHKPLGVGGWMRVILRGVPLALLVFGCLILLLLVRMVEAPLFGLHRPWTPYITRFVCRNAFRILGIGFSSRGRPMTHRGAVVANHSSWLDIFTLNARKNVYFVSKAEVAKWPGIGWLARATGTVFINRDRREAAAQKKVFEDRLLAGHKLLFFPEGTSTDGQQILPFKSTLFAAFFDERLREEMHIQPVTVRYIAPQGEDPRFYGWWGDMDFGPHLLITLGARRQGRVEVVYHPELVVSDYTSRKALAEAAETSVRSALVVAQ
ncbi:lyso-ornithine lipid acyltransferase [Shimia haliotis]|uniref:Lyso-ornithine lipid acyltransferase n=2 Tax=Shimia haliotis TaxID=1280847 RepID=A0A1I4AZF0_9RHOB|nr:lyso-ornithine lipid acyltransferase [Shimia haliotis]